MAEELKDLIEKIQTEGVKAAEDRAKEITDEAGRKAGAIVKDAAREAERLTGEARDRIAKMEESSRASLKQAGRDLILSLREEINAMLDKIVASHVHKALDHGELAGVIQTLVKERAGEAATGIEISLRKEDLEKLEKGFLNQLRDEVKKGVTLKASDDIHGGLTISYDDGKSYYDFTDKALAKYIALYLKPKLAEILNGS